MKNIKEIWKKKAQNKDITSGDVISYCALRALLAKSNDKKEIARHFASKAFSPCKRGNDPYGGTRNALYLEKRKITWNKTVLGLPINEIFDSEEEFKAFEEILESLWPCDFNRHYTYVFVRQDLSPEYQLVQAAHATMVLGNKLYDLYDPREIYFAVIGVENLKALNMTMIELNANNFMYEKFVEPDIGNQVTAVATYPIFWKDREPLRKYNSLKFSQINS